MAKKTKKISPSSNSARDLTKLDETGQRKSNDRRVTNQQLVPALDRRKVKRRRQIDPTTCEREYSEQEIEFMRAMDEYKRASGRMFPTCSEILEVLTKIGYRQIAESQPLYVPQEESQSDSEALELDEAEIEESIF